MKILMMVVVSASLAATHSFAKAEATFPTSTKDTLVLAQNGTPIPAPTSTATYPVKEGGTTLSVPKNMVYVSSPVIAPKNSASTQRDAISPFFIGRFEVTNAEWKEFIGATKRHAPRYWKDSTYPAGKANHPVLFVSLADTEAYCDWISKATGWKIVIPSAEQWEWAARGAQQGRYPWGNDKEVSYKAGKIESRFNYNAVCAAHFLGLGDVVTSYSDARYKGKPVALKDVSDGKRTLSVSPDGNVTGWINHEAKTGFVGTKLYRDLVNEGGFTTPVGSYEKGKSWCGAYDMAGNAYEWTSSLIIASNGAEKGKQVNDVRGGSWYSNGNSCVSTFTGEGRAGNTGYHSVGFRIAMLPAP